MEIYSPGDETENVTYGEKDKTVTEGNTGGIYTVTWENRLVFQRRHL